jgi:retron-type reverse transcriptase
MAKLLPKVWRTQNLESAWRAIRSNGRSSLSPQTRSEIEEFDACSSQQIVRIQERLRKNRFVFQSARGAKIKKQGKPGAFRPLVIAKVESRVVQRAIHNVLIDQQGIKNIVDTPYSFGGVKKHEGQVLAAVPGAIQALLDEIGVGATFVIRSDIKAFFTKIPKSQVMSTISDILADDSFVNFLHEAIKVDLENSEELGTDLFAFPVDDLGVAQGSSLSPLLGNIYLADFDRKMNELKGVKCLRYIDDFIILGKDKPTCLRAFKSAVTLLEEKGLEISPDKTQMRAVSAGFEFLGIEITPGFIRPSKTARARLLALASDAYKASLESFRKCRLGADPLPDRSLARTLTRVNGIVYGWGMHYFFCNDSTVVKQLDLELEKLLDSYLAGFKREAAQVGKLLRAKFLGVSPLSVATRKPFVYPKKYKSDATGTS